MANSTLVQEHLKIKRTALDTWTINEKLRLASFVEKNGNQNWASVSRSMKAYFQEPEEWSWAKPRPADWYSAKNCSQQFALLLENFETPKRKKRTGGSEETQVQIIKRTLLKMRNEEIDQSLLTIQKGYLDILDRLHAVLDDDKNALNSTLADIERFKLEDVKAEEEYQRWLKEREDRRIELERACRSIPAISLAVSNIRRESSLSEPSSDADSPLSEPLAVDVPEEISMKPLTVPTPTSPLLTSLLKSPAGASAGLMPTSVTPPTSILHSAITSPHRGATLPGRINTSPITVSPNVVSPNIKSLVSTALGSLDEQKPVVPTQSPSQGAPTLSMLLELPPSLPGKPLPVLPAPPPYAGHLGPPPPYSQATKYLEKQRAEQAAQAAQLAIKNELIMSSNLAAEVNVALPKTSPKKLDIDLDDIAEVIAVDVSRSQFNTDHNYVESKREDLLPPVVAPTPPPPPPTPPVSAPVPVEVVEVKTEKNELDVFDFEEEENETKSTYLINKKVKKELIKVMNEPETLQAPIEEIVETEVHTVDVVDEPVIEHADLVEEVLKTEVEAIEEVVINEGGRIEEGPVVVEEVVAKEEEVEKEAEVDASVVEEAVVLEDSLECEINAEDVPPADVVVEGKVEEVKVEEEPEMAALDSTSIEEVKEKPASSETPTVAGVKRRRGTAVDSRPSSPAPISEEEKDYKNWKKSLLLAHSWIEGHKSASLFQKPITDDQAPDYSKIILKPMDLSTMKRNIESGVIKTNEEYLRDMLHMFFNARIFNNKQSVVYKQAVEMMEDCVEHILVMMDLRGELPTWWKRPRPKTETAKTRMLRTSIQPNTRASVKSTKRVSGSSDPPRKKIKVEDTT